MRVAKSIARDILGCASWIAVQEVVAPVVAPAPTGGREELPAAIVEE